MAIPLQRAEALFDFEPTADVELELKKGDVVFVRRTSVGEGWWEGELNGRRGLFPSSFVKMLPVSQGSPIKERPMTPITPRSSKKMFMDALLAPATLTQEPLYDRDKAADIFAPGHADISITVGPAWDCNPPSLTVAIKHIQTESRFSGMKHTTVFEVETEQLGTCVPRRYKHFLWLYDRMAELFPCISLPPLPVKHFAGLSDGENNEARRRGLEKFLIRIARHPVLASTKLFHEFLTARDEKDWKIGRHLSKILKTKKLMFSSPFYYSVKYPPFNVPVHQLSSVEKFSKFSRFMETTVQTLQQSCHQLTTMNADVITCICMLGRDLQRFSSGLQPVSGAWIVAQRRKHAAAAPSVAVNGPSPLHVSSVAPHRATTVSLDIDDGSSDEEMFDVDAQWNWREDKRFAQMTENLHDLAGRMKKFKPFLHRHQEAMDRQVQDTLDDYSGIIHTLPVLVKQHEEAMELFNVTREKETKKDAEEIRQHCDTLNNILLAEFDYFSKTMIDDFEVMAARLLKQQADFHRKLADELEALHRNYTARAFSTHSDRDQEEESFYRSRSTSGSKDASSFLKSGSIDLTSSQDSTSSEPFQRSSTKDNLFEASNTSQTSQTSVKTLTTLGTGIPTYINVELKARRAESSDSEIDEDLLKPPCERGKPEPYPVATDTVVEDTHSAMETVKTVHLDPPTPFDDPSDCVDCERTLTEQDTNDDHLSPFAAIEDDDRESTPSYHNYANLDFAQVHNLLSQAPKTAAAADEEVTSPKGPKKPMPIQRKYKSTAILSQTEDAEDGNAPTTGSPVRNPIPKKPTPPVKPPNLLNQDADSTADSTKFQRTWSPKNSSTPNGNVKPLPASSKLLVASSSSSSGGGGRTKDDTLVNTGVSTAPPPPSSTKPRSHTTIEKLFSPGVSILPTEKKQPILPPATRSSRSPSPTETAADMPPPSQLAKERLAAEDDKTRLDKTVVTASSATVAVKKPALKPHVSDSTAVRSRPLASTSSTLNRVNKPTYTTQTGRFPRTFVGGASTGNNHTSSSEQDELMKKLTLRRQRIDEQLAITTKSTTAPYTTSTKTSSPIPKPSPPSLSSKTTHRVSAPLGNKSPVAMNNSSMRSGEISSERNSTISTSSSEVIVTYRKLDESPSLTSLSSNGTTYSVDGGGGNGGGVLMRKTEETMETNLAKYGIIEEGGSYVI